MKMIKKLLHGAIAAAVLVGTMPASGCSEDNPAEIEKLDNLTKELQARIATLETFKSWAETNGDGFQSQIDAIEAALAEAQELIAGSDNPIELTRRLDELIAGSTLSIAQIQSALEDHDEALDDLYTLLGAIEGGSGPANLLRRIAALEQADTDILERLNNIGSGGSGGVDLTALWNAIAGLEEMLLNRIGSIVFIPDRADGGTNGIVARSDPYKYEPTRVVEPLTVNYLVAPAACATILAEKIDRLSGVVNRVTRAIAGEATVTEVTATPEGVLTVTYAIDPSLLPADLTTGGIQIALKAALGEGNDYTGDFVNVAIDEQTYAAAPSLVTYTQGNVADPQPEDIVLMNADWCNGVIGPDRAVPVPGQVVRDGIILYDYQAGGLTLDLVNHDPDWARVDPDKYRITYTMGEQYAWNESNSRWDQVTPVTAALSPENVVTWTGAIPPVYTNRVIFGISVYDPTFDLPENQRIAVGTFAIEFPGITLTEFSQAGRPLFYSLIDTGEPDGWPSPGASTPEGMIPYAPGLVLDIEFGPAADAAAIDPGVEISYWESFEMQWDALGRRWVSSSGDDVTVSLTGEVTATSTYRHKRVVVGMYVNDTSVTDYEDRFYFVIDIPASGTASLNVLDAITDPQFRARIEAGMLPTENGWDTDDDGILTETEALAVEELDLSGLGITSLAGIEYFTELWNLNVMGNNIPSISLEFNTKLKELYCGDNALDNLDVSYNTLLQHLNCAGNDLTELNLSNNAALEILYCGGNDFSVPGLDVKGNTALKDLSCYECGLTELDVTCNTLLEYLYCWSNELTELVVTQNTGLSELVCSYNLLEEMDITQNPSLVEFHCSDNPGDGAEFRVAAAFEDVPASGFSTGDWDYEGNTITVKYYKP